MCQLGVSVPPAWMQSQVYVVSTPSMIIVSHVVMIYMPSSPSLPRVSNLNVFTGQ